VPVPLHLVVISAWVNVHYWLTLYFSASPPSFTLFCFLSSWWSSFCFFLLLLICPPFFLFYCLTNTAGFLSFSVLIFCRASTSSTLACLLLSWSNEDRLFILAPTISNLFFLTWLTKTLYWSHGHIYCLYYLGSALGLFFYSSLSALVIGLLSWNSLLFRLLSISPLHIILCVLQSGTIGCICWHGRPTPPWNILT